MCYCAIIKRKILARIKFVVVKDGFMKVMMVDRTIAGVENPPKQMRMSSMRRRTVFVGRQGRCWVMRHNI